MYRQCTDLLPTARVSANDTIRYTPSSTILDLTGPVCASTPLLTNRRPELVSTPVGKPSSNTPSCQSRLRELVAKAAPNDDVIPSLECSQAWCTLSGTPPTLDTFA